ncbi:MAG: DUF2806 domain-containing protein [Deltaproteobacteria bacterium]|nr:MAG: DUF2806 domain-containing protein [Deltaproteobacteria bacterium]TMQ26830.1 MAG: DUF2806 domain-containing protein [Deltaproteobacteria bacterium]
MGARRWERVGDGRANNVTVTDPIYTDHGVNFDSIKHLEDIGLVSFQRSDGTFGKLVDERPAMVMYFGERFLLEVQESHPLRLTIGSVMLTTIGKELAPIAGAEPLPAFRDFVLRRWATIIKPHSAL